MIPDKFGKIILFILIVIAVVIVFVWFVLPSMTPEAMFAELQQKYRLPTEAEVLTWSHTDEEPPEVVWYYDGEITHRYTLDN